MFQFQWCPETLPMTLGVMAKGLIGIFAVILVIMAFVAVMGRISSGKKQS